ncbi:hypothetical protein AYI68_g1789 [Smittium mucronatum]|uniref:Uncharacterized protein n=1 Tax=Smittium mucronatum TaxID=133383 RepID=A0A1R0H4E0_9FUNG|nr:hypothetical protein AYI68_g1789 [Smittium mucronatum]
MESNIVESHGLLLFSPEFSDDEYSNGSDFDIFDSNSTKKKGNKPINEINYTPKIDQDKNLISFLVVPKRQFHKFQRLGQRKTWPKRN